jgi:hypothetical protein
MIYVTILEHDCCYYYYYCYYCHLYCRSTNCPFPLPVCRSLRAVSEPRLARRGYQRRHTDNLFNRRKSHHSVLLLNPSQKKRRLAKSLFRAPIQCHSALVRNVHIQVAVAPRVNPRSISDGRPMESDESCLYFCLIVCEMS